MRIEIDEDGDFVLKEVYNGITLETKSGKTLHICMRDDGFEFAYGDCVWEAKQGQVNRLSSPKGLDCDRVENFFAIDPPTFNKWKMTGLLDESIAPPMVAIVLEAAITFLGEVEKDLHKKNKAVNLLLPTLIRVYKSKNYLVDYLNVIKSTHQLLTELAPLFSSQKERKDWEAELSEWVAFAIMNEITDMEYKKKIHRVAEGKRVIPHVPKEDRTTFPGGF